MPCQCHANVCWTSANKNNPGPIFGALPRFSSARRACESQYLLCGAILPTPPRAQRVRAWRSFRVRLVLSVTAIPVTHPALRTCPVPLLATPHPLLEFRVVDMSGPARKHCPHARALENAAGDRTVHRGACSCLLSASPVRRWAS